MKKNIMRILFVALLLAIVITGCVSGPIGNLPTIAEEEGAGEVTVIRISSIVGATNSFKITLNGKEIFGIRSGQYTTFKLNEGKHEIGIKCIGGWAPTWKEETVKLTVSRNSNSYFLVGPGRRCAYIRRITEEEGQERIQKSEYVSMEQQ